MKTSYPACNIPQDPADLKHNDFENNTDGDNKWI